VVEIVMEKSEIEDLVIVDFVEYMRDFVVGKDEEEED
jgi:hypothetical protein